MKTISDEKLNIHQRINAIRKAVSYVQKDKAVSTGGGSYKAVTHDAVTGMIRPALIEYGVVIIPSIISSVFNQKDGDSKQRLYEATYQIDFVNCDDPTDKITTIQNAHAMDNGDKSPGKAMSYATKYAMLKIFSIETGDDEESRYQFEEFDYSSMIEEINACNDMQTLQKVFISAYRQVEDSKDKNAMRVVMAAKNQKKAELVEQEKSA